MIKASIPNRSKSMSLTAQIRDAERQVLKRQRGIGVRADALARKIQQQMTAPATLLLAGGASDLSLANSPSAKSPNSVALSINHALPELNP